MYTKRVKLRDNGGNLVLTIPRDLVRHFGLAAGTAYDIFCDNRQLTVDLTSAERTKLFDAPAKVEEPVA
jgi:antitoxin component of MazEF toxin-antitoxin module